MSICKVCGKSFKGRKNAAFCSPACAKKQQSLYTRRYYYKTKLLNSGYTDEEATKMAKEKYAYKTPIVQPEEKTIIQQDNVSPVVAKQDEITFDWALETDEYIKDVGAIRGYAKELESVVGKLMVYYNKYSNRFNEIEKEKILQNHQLESYKSCPSDDFMIEYGKKTYELVKERRIAQLISDTLYKCIGSVPKQTDKFVVNCFGFQDVLNDKYAEKKEWNTDKWRISHNKPTLNNFIRKGESRK
ncbi:MAG: hypothetical protein J6T10_32490 [Methanobrevibacter sp.]|nr:hypothetical protein [Methanobrevibacter sp.]